MLEQTSRDNNDDHSYYLLRTSCVPGAVLSACHLTDSPFTTTLCSRDWKGQGQV